MHIAPLLLVFALAGCTAHADSHGHSHADRTHARASDPCEDTGEARPGRTRLCEVRTLQLDRRDLALDAHMNGSVHVVGWDRDDIEFLAIVEAEAGSDAEARRLMRETRVLTDGTVRVDAPDTRHSGRRSGQRSDWVSVHFNVRMPHAAALSAKALNGSISIDGVTGRLRASTLNGSVRIEGAGGEVDAETVNGAIDLRLADGAARGAGIRAHTVNGAVAVTMPTSFSADLRARTVMGSIRLDDTLGCGRPGCRRSGVESTRGRLEAVLGRGGAPMDVSTTNGSVRLRAR